MQEAEIRKRATVIKWFLVVALLPLAVVIVGSVPAIRAATGNVVPQSLMEKAMLTTMFFVPLVAVFLMMPVIKQLGRSMLWWGLGIVFLPLGTFILGGWLLYLASNHQSSTAGDA